MGGVQGERKTMEAVSAGSASLRTDPCCKAELCLVAGHNTVKASTLDSRRLCHLLSSVILKISPHCWS